MNDPRNAPNPTPQAPNSKSTRASPRQTLLHWLIAGLLAAGVLWLFFSQTVAPQNPTGPTISGYDARALRQLLTAQMPEIDTGSPRTLNEWRGKPLVINFWATWCPPCQKELPDFAALARHYAGGVHFVGLGLDERDKLLAFAREFDLPYPTLVAGGFALGQTTKLGNPNRGMPFTLVLDANGQPVAHHVGLISRERLETLIAQALER
ncbi:TlpA disulfide reductase family protein [Hydrogenophilus thiooxidans]|uniref:TlpA disulfide reductase family protein n=1 Tax=Hydrogenophilus thiooxidans TaxID=2820326 RepID=UPI001C21033F|nr:TlpA disulfide reductase family protein [Hydrogenophilus thiooxidans]